MKRRKVPPAKKPFLSQLFEANPQPLVAFDLKSLQVVFANKAAVELYGYSREEFLALKATDLRPGEDIPAFQRALKELSAGGQRRWNWRHLAKGGRILEVEAVNSLIRWKSRPAVLVAVDKAHKREGPAADPAAKDLLFKLMVEHVEELAFFTLDAEGRVASWNTGAQRITGHRDEDILGLPFSEFFRPEDVEIHLPAAFLARARRDGMAKEEVLLRRRDGGKLWSSLVLTPLKDASGTVTGFAVVLRDVSERKRADEEGRRRLEAERQSRSEAEAASRSKDEFLAVVSHELRTPMTAILGWTWLLRSGGLAEGDRSQALEAIERNMKLQSQIIEQLLDISSIVTGKIYLVKRPIPAGGSLRDAVASVAPLAAQKKILLETRASKEAMVRADPHRLQQILWHLLANAVKFSRPGGTVRTGLETNGDWAVFRIEDEGQGIAPEYLPHVFDPLRQEEDSLTRQHSGLGIGLAIVKNLVRLHEGTVTAESPGRDRGATFVVRLPLAQREAPAPVLLDPVPLPPHLRFPHSLDDLKILLVDDEPDSLKVLSELLAHCGAEVSTAASASEALLALSHGAPNILISDIAMPSEDGYALIRRVRSLDREKGGAVPALALTACARPEDREKALQAGFQGYLAKPVEPAQLVAALLRLAGRSVDTISK